MATKIDSALNNQWYVLGQLYERVTLRESMARTDQYLAHALGKSFKLSDAISEQTKEALRKTFPDYSLRAGNKQN